VKTFFELALPGALFIPDYVAFLSGNSTPIGQGETDILPDQL
jgi:hypothetical protein